VRLLSRYLEMRASATLAAWYPPMPCTPPPGGVEAEQIYTPGSGVRYGPGQATGRASTCLKSIIPPLMSPPM
jgi:hypothetical protein